MITIKFEFEKETPRTKRYQEVLEDGRERGVVGTLYVLKSDLEKIGSPDKIEVTIKAAKK